MRGLEERRRQERRAIVSGYLKSERRRRERRETLRKAQVNHFCDRFYFAALQAGTTYRN